MNVLFRQADVSTVVLEVLQLPAAVSLLPELQTVMDRHGTDRYLPTWLMPLVTDMAQGALPTWHTPLFNDMA
jgi:hypothetical protein